MEKLLSVPLQVPKIEPTDWNKWWPLWYKESQVIRKISNNHNARSAPWRGFDVWVKPGIDSEEHTKYKSKNLNCPELFSSIFDNLDKFPIDIEIVRVVSSFGPVLPHTDYDSEWLSVRSLIYDNNIKPNFYYLNGGEKQYQLLPEDTNTWAYWDHKRKHGTEWYFGHSKILITYFGKLKANSFSNILELGLKNYSNFAIYI